MDVPCNIKEIQEKIERNSSDKFIQSSVPELFCWDIGLEYLGGDSVEFYWTM
jgi:hypothetical protein